jgi:hypothetical protein
MGRGRERKRLRRIEIIERGGEEREEDKEMSIAGKG